MPYIRLSVAMFVIVVEANIGPNRKHLFDCSLAIGSFMPLSHGKCDTDLL